MLQRAVAWLVGSRRQQPVAEEERRVWIRHPYDVETTCRAVNTRPEDRLSARVQDISRGGINLLVNRPVDLDTLLSVELPGTPEQPPSTVLAYVVRVVPRGPGGWALGCTFATELRDEELQPFGPKRLKPPPSDQRLWVRFPCRVQAAFQPVTTPAAEPRHAKVLDISANGIGLLVGEPVEMGTLLSLELRSPGGKRVLTILGCVVRSTAESECQWALGCNFIRDLTDQELRELT
jgi:hypothetical protein